MDGKKRISIFYGGGSPKDDSNQEGTNSCPFQGDPLSATLASFKAHWEDLGGNIDDLGERIRDLTTIRNRILLKDEGITINGKYPLKDLKPSETAFYALVATHKEGLEVGRFHELYLDDYQDLFYSLKRKRKVKNKHGITFELDRRAQSYKTAINSIIEAIEDRYGVQLPDCYIAGKTRWRLGAEVTNLMGTNSLKEL